MTVLGWLGWILLAAMGLWYIAVTRFLARQAEALSEFIEFLYQNRIVYNDHRKKYAAFLEDTLRGSPQLTVRQLALIAKGAVDSAAESLYKQIAPSNALGRGAVKKWIDHDSIAESTQTETVL